MRQVIEQIEAADALSGVPNVTKIGGSENPYRIRVGDYRIGVSVIEEEAEFVRCPHRRDIYRYFP